jgi:[CysO sulfur-carrier protein]-S-L-cysteine hydrolase
MLVAVHPDGKAAAVDNHFSKSIGKKVFIKQDILLGMIDYCSTQLPYEACGILSGRGSYNETLWLMKNTEKSTTSFAMDMQEVEKSMELIRKRNERLTGIFHSHPRAPAYPSIGDIKNWHYPNSAYLIISFSKGLPEVRCYSIVNYKVKQLELIILD